MSIKFGISVAGSESVISFAREAEALGYDYITAGDHVTFRGREMPSVIPQRAIAAGATERIRLMSTILLLPLYNPVIVAKQTSVLDVGCGGRFELGIGIGAESPKEFEACGIPLQQRGSRANESLGIIRRLWTEDVSAKGRHNNFTNVTLLPKPV
jgi:alkanesulfonate monooxygenase SsuD/methylene tetrahydromethanopterin reductase-like flavin-dependent oxidoreductase (luciferase family)